MLVVITDVFINAIDRADTDASGIETVDAKPGYSPWHSGTILTCALLRIIYPVRAIRDSYDRAGRIAFRSFCHSRAADSTATAENAPDSRIIPNIANEITACKCLQ
jgi:hypothetical protein